MSNAMIAALPMVEIREAVFYGKPFSGTFPFVEKMTDKECKRDVYLRIFKDGKLITCQSFNKDYTLLGAVGSAVEQDVETVVSVQKSSADMDEAELDAMIATRFEVLDDMAEMVVSGDIHALIVAGAAGIGKTYTLEERLKKAALNAEINKFTHMKGRITGMALYAELFKHKDEGDVIMFDDCDSVFNSEDSLNLLKGALDTSKTRHLSWKTTSTWLDDNGIDDEFEFKGTIVFISNLDFDRMIEKNNADAPHYKALISRCNFLNLRVHTRREVLTRVKQIIKTTSLAADHGLDAAQTDEMVEWLETNVNSMREISIRTVFKIAGFMKKAKNWKATAEVMLLM